MASASSTSCSVNPLAASAEELYAALRPEVEREGEILSNAVAIVGIAPDSVSINRMGPSAGSAWQAWTASNTTLMNLRQIICGIYAASGKSARDIPKGLWFKLDPEIPYATVERLNVFTVFPEIAAAGLTITLNRPADVAAWQTKRDAHRPIEGNDAA